MEQFDFYKRKLKNLIDKSKDSWEYEIMPQVKEVASKANDNLDILGDKIQQGWKENIKPKLEDAGEAINKGVDVAYDRIEEYVESVKDKVLDSKVLSPPFDIIVRNGITAAAAAGPLGLFGAVDTAAIAGIWTTMIIAINEKSIRKIDNVTDFVKSVAAGFCSYYIGCKAANMIVSLFPGGIILGVATSTATNIYFTYRMAEIVVEMLNSPRYELEKPEHYVSFALKLLKKLPSAKEITAVVLLYKKWKS